MSRKLLLSALVAGAMAFSTVTYAPAQERREGDRGGDQRRGNWTRRSSANR